MKQLPPPSKIRRKALVWLVLSLYAAFGLNAQDISVASFRALENDLTANTYGTTEKDQNGEVAALIKIVTKEKGFLFDGGMTGIVKVKQDVGEIWVYVPHGIKRITIKHPDLGVLRDYYFPVPIEKARTYEMKLTTAKVETVVTHSVNKQFVSFQVNPPHAMVELNDEMLMVDANGHAEKVVAYGKYTYRVSCADYHTHAGQVTVGPDAKAMVNVKLKPHFGWVDFQTTEEFHGALVYIDNERIGELPLPMPTLKSGKHQVRLVKPLYKSFEQNIDIQDGDTLVLPIQMQANFARVELISNHPDNEIWVDGQFRAKGQWKGGMETGEYLLEVKRTSHRTHSEVLHILDHESRQVKLGNPTPIHTFVAISSTPSEAKVFIDGQEVGETPLMLNEVLMGHREIKLSKKGYIDLVDTAYLEENKENALSYTMEEMPEEIKISIASSPKAAAVVVDGKHIGVTPLRHALPIGSHQFELHKAGYQTLTQAQDISLDGKHEFTFVLQKQPWSQRSYNAPFRRLAAYAALQAEFDYPQNELAYGASLGCYLYGVNVEATYSISSLTHLQAMLGYGIALGKKLMLTPQVGVKLYTGVPCSEFTYTEDASGAFSESRRDYEASLMGYAAALRIQYCLSKNIALSLMPEYSYFQAETTQAVNEHLLGGIAVKAALIINFGRE